MSFSVDSFSGGSLASAAFAMSTPTVNISFSADAFSQEAFSVDAFAFATPTPVVVIFDTHDGERTYRKRRLQNAELRAMIEAAVNGPATPVLAKVAKVVEPYQAKAKVDLTGAKEEVIARLEAFHAEYMRQIEDDDEEALLMVLN